MDWGWTELLLSWKGILVLTVALLLVIWFITRLTDLAEDLWRRWRG